MKNCCRSLSQYLFFFFLTDDFVGEFGAKQLLCCVISQILVAVDWVSVVNKLFLILVTVSFRSTKNGCSCNGSGSKRFLY